MKYKFNWNLESRGGKNGLEEILEEKLCKNLP